MTTAIWYYVDNAGVRVGPVTADAVREALRLHGTSLTSLAWREGLPTWFPISHFAAELGLSGVVPPLPSQAPQAPQAPSYRHEDDIVYAGFLRRWAALFLDQLILVIPLGLLVGLVSVVLVGSNPNTRSVLLMEGLFYLAWLLAAPLYYAGMESSTGQATLGKRVLGIKVTDNDGRRLGFGHALGRWFAAALSYLTFYIGFLMAAFTDRKRALHDMVAGTLVVDRWAFTDHPERQQRSLPGCLIAFLIGMLLCLVVVPILAAIAISQYQDYVVRSQVSEGSSLADGVKTAMTEYYNNRGEWPESNANAGLAAPASIVGEYVGYVDVGQSPGRIDIGYSSEAPQNANSAIAGKHLYFLGEVQEGSIAWHCASDDLKQKWCPSSCSCGG